MVRDMQVLSDAGTSTVPRSCEFEDELSDFAFSIEPFHSARHPGLSSLKNPSGSAGQASDLCGFLFITQGDGQCLLDSDCFSIGANTVVILKPNRRLRVYSTRDLCGFEVLFSESFLTLNEMVAHRLPGAGLFDPSFERDCLTLSTPSANRLMGLVRELKNEHDGQEFAHRSALRSLLLVVLVHLNRLVGTTAEGLTGKGRNGVAVRYQKLVAEDPRLDRSVSYYASSLDVSPSHLHELVKESTGLNPIAIIQREVIQESKRLLIHTPSQIAEIASRLAFKDASYFGRYFRRNTGMTPGEFRRKSRSMLGL